MTEKKAILCPNCNKLISSYVDKCPHCGLSAPSSKAKIYNALGANQRNFTKIIITVNVILFIASYLLPVVLQLNVPAFRMNSGLLGLPLPSPSGLSLDLLGWADIRYLVRGDWWILITAMFLHGGILHILFNMLWVRDLAPQTEILFSPHKMVIIYILSGIGGNLLALFTPVFAQAFFSISMNNYPVIGASGAVFGLMGGILAFGRKRGGFWGRQVVRQIGMWAVILIAMGFLFPGISNAGHIGGFLTGYLVGQLLPLKSSPSANKVYMALGTGLIVICGYSFVKMILRLIVVVNSQ